MCPITGDPVGGGQGPRVPVAGVERVHHDLHQVAYLHPDEEPVPAVGVVVPAAHDAAQVSQRQAKFLHADAVAVSDLGGHGIAHHPLDDPDPHPLHAGHDPTPTRPAEPVRTFGMVPAGVQGWGHTRDFTGR